MPSTSPARFAAEAETAALACSTRALSTSNLLMGSSSARDVPRRVGESRPSPPDTDARRREEPGAHVVHTRVRTPVPRAPVDPAVTVLVDAARYPAHGRWWAHLASDRSLAELHAFAAGLGVPRGAFEGDHYDVPAELVERAVAQGAEPVGTRELLRRVRAAGLRTPKRRGEKVLATTDVAGTRVDVVRAPRVPAPHGTGHLLSVTAAGVLLTAAGRLPLAPPGEPGGAPRPVLGFRRTWRRGADGTAVLHDPVLLSAPGEAPGAGPGARTAPLGDPAVTGAWWWPLAREHLVHESPVR